MKHHHWHSTQLDLGQYTLHLPLTTHTGLKIFIWVNKTSPNKRSEIICYEPRSPTNLNPLSRTQVRDIRTIVVKLWNWGIWTQIGGISQGGVQCFFLTVAVDDSVPVVPPFLSTARIIPARQFHSLILEIFNFPVPLTHRNLFPTNSSRYSIPIMAD